ncbi:MAG: hydroxymethylbilane synthase [Dehalococcoidia bacterium]|nr:hydroxymethylbilane synthase [Dehalococcoidia bacterium]
MTALRIATRGSPLALAQTRLAIDALRAVDPELETSVVEVSTEGDRDRTTPLAVLGGRGVFVRAVEDVLLEGRADLAVHSLKDVPGELAPGLVLGAFLPRGDARDALVASAGRRLAALPPGARVGTSSQRRVALLRALRPDLAVREIRGNVDTRLRKVADGEYDGAVLAAAGLERLGRLAEATQLFEAAEFPPAPGQGVIALQCRAGGDPADRALRALLARVDDGATRAAAAAERGFLAALGAGCALPVGAYARLDGGLLTVRGVIADPAGGAPAFGDATGAPAQAEALGRELAARLLAARGATTAGSPAHRERAR